MWCMNVAVGLACVFIVGCGGKRDKSSEISRLVATIKNDPDVLHNDYTPSVRALIRIGKPSIPATLDLMVNSDEDTRYYAETVLRGVTMEMYGFGQRRQWNKESEEAWKAFWVRCGQLDYRATSSDRMKAVSLWRKWFAAGCAVPAPTTPKTTQDADAHGNEGHSPPANATPRN
jgi:hypothetical protein